MEELQLAVTALQQAVTELGDRLAAYPEGTYDAEIANVTLSITGTTEVINSLAPTPLGHALGLTAVS